MKRTQLLHNLMGLLSAAAAREAVTVEPRGAECVGPGEYIVTVYGTPVEVSRLADALGRDGELRDPQVVEDVGQSNRQLHESADAGRRRHLHIALSAPSLW
jgi:hypothetical protein